MLTVSVPKLRAHGPRAAEVRPKRVEAWLSALPQASAEDSLQQILQALFVQNRTALDPDNRLSLMVLYLKPVLDIFESLNQTYINSPAPLSERQYALATSVQRLCLELANGYKIVANDLTLLDTIQGNKADFVQAVQRATDILSIILTNSYAIYRTCPEGVWRDLHQLYRISEAHQILHYPVEDMIGDGSEDGEITVYDSYQRALLIGACSPYGLSQGDGERLFKLIPRWHSTVHISKKLVKSKKDWAGYFLINLAADSAPVPMSKMAPQDIQSQNSEQLRLLNMLDVAREVHTELKGLGKGSSQKSGAFSGREDANADLLRRFGRVLAGVNVVRRSTRTVCNEPISVCIGLNATHFFASGQRHFKPEITGDDTPETTAQEPTQSVNDVAQTTEFFDLTDPEIGNRQDDEESVSQPGESMPSDPWQHSTNYRLYPCHVKDQSAGGLGIQVTCPSELRLRVGDLVGLQFPSPDQWRVGTIRWMRSTSPQLLDFGIQMLAPSFTPIGVSRNADPGSFFQGLLLPGNRALRQPESLLVPRGMHNPGEKLVLNNKEREKTTVSPLYLLDRTGSYDQLLITPSDSDESK